MSNAAEQNKRIPGNVLNVRCLAYNFHFQCMDYYIIFYSCRQLVKNSGNKLLSKTLNIMCLKSFSSDINISEFAVMSIFLGGSIRILYPWTSRRKAH